MRVKKEHIDIDYDKIEKFFKHRADKYKTDNPYSVTMYQDNNKQLVKDRNEYETRKLLKYLDMDCNSKILDVACGVGRWADAIKIDIAEYCGIDFSEEFINIAKKRNVRANFNYYIGSVKQLEDILNSNKKKQFNIVLVMGIMMYLNDDDIIEMLKQIERCCEEHSIICVREPIGINERLTLKDFYSNELADDYNAIYRTRDEFKDVFEKILMAKGFKIEEEGFLFDEDELNNRKETIQYYYIIKR